MLVLLWIFQIVFLEGFYKTIKSTQVEECAKQIATSVKSDADVSTIISDVSKRNEMSVYLFDTSSPIMLQKYCSDYNNPSVKADIKGHQAYLYYSKAVENNGTYLGAVSSSSDFKDSRVFEDAFTISTSPTTDKSTANSSETYSSDDADSGDSAKAKPDNDNGLSAPIDKYENLVYAEIINLDDGTQNFLLISAMITPVSSVVDTLRIQLIIVSIILFIFAFVLSIYVSRRIANPLSKITISAKELAKQNYHIEFEGSGYLEVKELNDTLNYARTELSKVDKLRQELIANISHDLRTPLTMIKGYGEVMRDLPGENTPENVQIIIDEASRLSNLVTDLLDLSKLQAGALTIDRSVFCLTDSIRDIFKRYVKLKEQDGYNISFEGSENVFVDGDELKLSQVIYNLVNNAINYVGEDKVVIVKQIVKENNRVRIEVTDHGQGISKENLEYIWDRYYKVDKQHKQAVIGTGLGLSIVKKILDLHNATYGADSIEGQGSTFWFEIDTVSPQEEN